MPPPLPQVRYGTASLADVMPSVLAALGIPGEPNPLHLPNTARAVVLLVDGLGWSLLRAHADAAPFLSAMAGRPLTAGFPSTTVASLASLGTGLPPGAHGLTGYSSYVEDVGTAVNWLAWRPVGDRRDLRDRLVPEAVQPRPTVFERAAAAGVQVTVASQRDFDGSGLTRAVFRGGRFRGTVTPGDMVAATVAGAQRGYRSLGYCYVSELDFVGHVRGAHDDATLVQLSLVDHLVAELAERLPSDVLLLVTADHGMVTVPEERKVDADASDALMDGVAALAGEPRMRHVHARPGAAADVLATWRATVGEDMWLLTRAEAVSAGLFGPEVSTDARARVGDVVAIAHGPTAVVRRSAEPLLSSLPGQHGSLTDDELLVPLLGAS